VRADYRVLIDSCVFVNFGVCDLLLWLGEKPRMLLPCWSVNIMDEVRRTHVEKLKWPKSLADTFLGKSANRPS